jgi:hypothetical protein
LEGERVSNEEYPVMTEAEKNKLRALRIKGKLGTLKESEERWCQEAFNKFGYEQYKSVISTEELYNATAPYGAKPYRK